MVATKKNISGGVLVKKIVVVVFFVCEEAHVSSFSSQVLQQNQ